MEQENPAAEADHPQISHEEYLELVNLRQQVIELKASKSDVQDFVMTGEQYIQQMPQAREQLQLINDQINERNTTLQSRFQEIVAPLGVAGDFTISDTEPHYVVASQTVDNFAAEETAAVEEPPLVAEA